MNWRRAAIERNSQQPKDTRKSNSQSKSLTSRVCEPLFGLLPDHNSCTQTTAAKARPAKQPNKQRNKATCKAALLGSEKGALLVCVGRCAGQDASFNYRLRTLTKAGSAFGSSSRNCSRFYSWIWLRVGQKQRCASIVFRS